jgi:putative phage-type endonuclease
METNDITDPAIRRTYLGGSEAAAALGVSPWESRVDLWMRKTGRAESPQITSGPALWGTLLEEPVADYWAETTGRKIRRQPKAYQHDVHPFLRGHIDRMVIGEADGPKILEVKTTGHWAAADWGPGGSDEIPMWYRIQLAHYFACTGYRVAECVVLVAGQDCRFYTVERNDELVASVVDGLAAFWTEHPEYCGA